MVTGHEETEVDPDVANDLSTTFHHGSHIKGWSNKEARTLSVRHMPTPTQESAPIIQQHRESRTLFRIT